MSNLSRIVKTPLKMDLRIIVDFINDFWWFVCRAVNEIFDPIKPPTKDLAEIARIGIAKKLQKFYKNNYKFEIRKWRNDANFGETSSEDEFFVEHSATEDVTPAMYQINSEDESSDDNSRTRYLRQDMDCRNVTNSGNASSNGLGWMTPRRKEIQSMYEWFADFERLSLDVNQGKIIPVRRESIDIIEYEAGGPAQEPEDVIFQMNIEPKEGVLSSDDKHTAVWFQSFIDNDIPASKCPKIKLVGLIAISSSQTYRGQVFGNKLVSVKCRQKIDTKHIQVAAKLSHHENILNHLFDFQNGSDFYIVSENFESSLARDVMPKDLKNLTRQICNGLQYLHEKGIAHGSIEASNIIKCNDRNRITYKIANFEDATLNARKEILAEDLKELGKLLTGLDFRARRQKTLQSNENLSDDYCLCDILEKLNEGCKIREIKQHPFLWTVHETLMFIVEIVKGMEPRKKYEVENILKICSKEILEGEDWRSRMLDIVKIQTETNKGRTPYGDLIGLLRTIRNLVRVSECIRF